jgi:hypothetical protein
MKEANRPDGVNFTELCGNIAGIHSFHISCIYHLKISFLATIKQTGIQNNQ